MRNIVALSIVVLLISCRKPIHPNNEITKIELAHYISIVNKGTIIDIDSSLNYNFYQFHHFWKHPEKDQSIFYNGKVNSSFWDTLNTRFESINYKTLDTIDKYPMVDGEGYELIVHWKNGRKRILRSIPAQSDSLLSVLYWLDCSYKIVKLKRTNTPFKFETTIQVLPKQKIDQIKFPPPVKQGY